MKGVFLIKKMKISEKELSHLHSGGVAAIGSVTPSVVMIMEMILIMMKTTKDGSVSGVVKVHNAHGCIGFWLWRWCADAE